MSIYVADMITVSMHVSDMIQWVYMYLVWLQWVYMYLIWYNEYICIWYDTMSIYASDMITTSIYGSHMITVSIYASDTITISIHVSDTIQWVYMYLIWYNEYTCIWYGYNKNYKLKQSVTNMLKTVEFRKTSE